jgi:hypothetical protein
VTERDTRVDSSHDEAVGWSRAAQDAAEAESPPVDFVDDEPRPFLDRPVGMYVTSRWIVVFLGGVLGAIVGFIVSLLALPSQWWDATSSLFTFAPAGFVFGCLATALILQLKSSSRATEASLRQRLADWIYLR